MVFVKTIDATLEKKLQIWTLIGPLCLILTLAVSFLKPSPHPTYVPYAALFGLIVCWRWQMKGFVLTFLLLITIAIYRAIGFPIEDKIWEGGLFTALSLGCLITALSFEEAKSLIEGEWSQPALEIEELQNELRLLQEKWEETSCRLANEISLGIELTNGKEQLNLQFQELKNELQKQQSWHEEAVQNLKDSREAFGRERTSLEAKLSKKEDEIILALEGKKTLEVNHKELADHYLKLQKEHQKVEITLQDSAQKHLAMASEKDTIIAEKVALMFQLQTIQDENVRLLGELEEAKKPVEPVKLDHWEEFRQAQGLYLQLREQFEEKSKALDQTRTELFHTQEKLDSTKKEFEEKYVYERSPAEKEMEKYLERVENQYGSQLEAMEVEIQTLQEIISGIMDMDKTR